MSLQPSSQWKLANRWSPWAQVGRSADPRRYRSGESRFDLAATRSRGSRCAQSWQTALLAREHRDRFEIDFICGVSVQCWNVSHRLMRISSVLTLALCSSISMLCPRSPPQRLLYFLSHCCCIFDNLLCSLRLKHNQIHYVIFFNNSEKMIIKAERWFAREPAVCII